MEEKAVTSASRTTGRMAHEQNIAAATLLADLIKTTLGPKGMDKMLLDSQNNIIATNDGATILKEMQLDHPAARMIAEISTTQENEIGDGTTTVAMLAGKLLEHAGKLLKKDIHATTIIKGYNLALNKCLEVLEEQAVDVDSNSLKQIAMTAMTGKNAEENRGDLADIILNAVDIVSKSELNPIENIKIEKIKGDVSSAELIKGIVLDKDIPNESMPKKIEKAKIALLDFGIEIKAPELDIQTQISTPDQLKEFADAENKALTEMVEKLHQEEVKVVFTNKGIDDYAQTLFADCGIMAIRRINKYDLELLARATGAKIIPRHEEVNKVFFGEAGVVEQIRSKNTSMIYVRECEYPEAVTILIHGSSNHTMDEVKRAITDAIGDVVASQGGKIVAGGGAIEVELASQIREFSRVLEGREQMAVEEFANVLEVIPETLAQNAGLDSIGILATLRKFHKAEGNRHGLNLFKDEIEDTLEAGIVDPLKVKTQAIKSATETAITILRVDDILLSKAPAQQ